MAADKVDFNRDVRPILTNHCFACHGPDAKSRKADLRLDRRESALAVGEERAAVVPGKPGDSELTARVSSKDAGRVMPPESFKKPLTEAQKAVLERWIAQGADYAEHWAFAAPKRPGVPVTRDKTWAKNPIDAFVLARLERENLHPSPQATRAQWLRRVTLDLTGLPPAPEDYRAFEGDPSPGAYGAAVDRLLKSPRHAERMAVPWLDLARYADTNGYNNDELRTMWPWRDWVIRAFAENVPYDRFLTEQLAGDLLPNATPAQRVATGFNRNHVLTTEGGIVEEEYRVEYVADRVHTAATAMLGLSVNCARCHDHKYDPISQEEYYRFSAFFSNLPDKIVGYGSGIRMAEPLLKVPSPEQVSALAKLEKRRIAAELAVAGRLKTLDADLAAWESALKPGERPTSARPAAHFPLDDAAGATARNLGDGTEQAALKGTAARVPGKSGSAFRFDGTAFLEAESVGDFDSDQSLTISVWVKPDSKAAGAILSRMDDGNANRGYDLLVEEGKVAAHFIHRWSDDGFKVVSRSAIPEKQWTHVAIVYDGSRVAKGVRLYFNGKLEPLDVPNDKPLKGSMKTDKPFHIGRRGQSLPFRGDIQHVRIDGRALSEPEIAAIFAGLPPDELKEILETPAAERTAAQKAALRRHFAERFDPIGRKLKAERDGIAAEVKAVQDAVPATMVMGEMTPPRKNYILKRGEYDKRGDEVAAGVPAVFPPLPADLPPNRLALAKWLTSPDHPLTARVAVNRWWEMLFGVGLVETSEDFGIQGTLPSHPELLDYLAVELVRSGWDTRAILKEIALSATYRQSSRATAELKERDPRNRLLARGPRQRLPAEALRDQALFVSGLLVERVGGPSVKPYQPDGLWEDVSVERRDKYAADSGDGLYRRTVYTFWKRTCPPPAPTLFDAPDRETCTVRRATTNTPLHALVVMNDPTYVESSRKLAERALRHSPDDAARIAFLGTLLLGRSWTGAESKEIRSSLADFREHFRKRPDEAEKLSKVGRSPRDAGLPVGELAAWSALGSMLLNLSEVVTKP